MGVCHKSGYMSVWRALWFSATGTRFIERLYDLDHDVPVPLLVSSSAQGSREDID